MEATEMYIVLEGNVRLEQNRCGNFTITCNGNSAAPDRTTGRRPIKMTDCVGTRSASWGRARTSASWPCCYRGSVSRTSASGRR